MYQFRSNPPSRQIPPRPVLLPSAKAFVETETRTYGPRDFTPYHRQGALMRCIDDYLSTVGMAPSAFGRLAANDPALVTDMRKGRAIGTGVAEKIIAFLTRVGQQVAHA